MSRVTLRPGELHVSKNPELVISTLLGSCVSACLYDAGAGVFGMNHFLLASRSFRQETTFTTEAGRYGVNAMELLINGLLKNGAQRNRLQAKVFGGANVLHHAGGQFAIGELNARFVTDFLRQESIPVVASDLGGQKGRQLHFVGRDYAAYVKLLGNDKRTSIAADESNYLKKRLAEQNTSATGGVVFFDE